MVNFGSESLLASNDLILPSSAQLNPTPTSVGWAEISLISTFELGTAQSQLV